MNRNCKYRLAAAQYKISRHKNWPSFAGKIAGLAVQATDSAARLLLLPEYFSMELAALFAEKVQSSLSQQLDSLQELLPEFLGLFAGISQEAGLHILAGTYPVRVDHARYVNRAYFFSPDGCVQYQDKLQMTRFENEQWGISAGDEIKVFDSELGKIGVSICYDSEFPLIARRQVELGASLLLVPSCTDTLAGYHRVRIGCQARALENQCYVAHSTTVGDAPWLEAIDLNVGAAAVYTPVDRGFPDNGVLALGEMNQSQMLFADVDLESLDRVRKTGQVFNHRDWDKQKNFL
ncbi:MAG: carbon-nitrogen hydrolase family protein [bacterium]|nr:carbon-nitrogen hydrolase family protein [bacterium]